MKFKAIAHDSGSLSCSSDFRHKGVGEEKVTNMVGTKLGLETFRGDSVFFDTHDSGVIDGYINFLNRVVDCFGCASYGCKLGEVKLDEFHMCCGAGRLELFDY